jgi:two-component system, chemotaxis family, chemotaxis protein CheY
MKFIPTPFLHEGMVLAQDLLTSNGELVLQKGQKLKKIHISKIKAFGYPGVYTNDNILKVKDASKKQVLVVDDSLFMRRFIGNVLTNNGYSVVGDAENGEIAVAKYEELHPDVVTMDITMPVLDGVGALEKIRRYDSKAKIVMVTSLGQDEVTQKALSLGAVTFITKPFKDTDILYTINKIFET